jgi:hypothetical protein
VVGKISDYLTEALKAHYGDNMEKQIAQAIDSVREN